MTILPTINEKINQAYLYGSLCLALDEGFFTAQDLLERFGEWMISTKFACRALVALKRSMEFRDMRLRDGRHILEVTPLYCVYFKWLKTYVVRGASLDLDDFDIPENIKVQARLYMERQSAEYIHKIVTDTEKLDEICHVRSVTGSFLLRRAAPDHVNMCLVNADWIQQLFYNALLIHRVVRRVKFLTRHAPVYYSCVAHKSYRKVVQSLHKDGLLQHLKRQDLSEVDTFFPGIIDVRILKLSEPAYEIAMMGNVCGGYILGFPIQNMVPDHEMFMTAVIRLSTEGVEKYAESLRAYVPSTYALPVFGVVTQESNDDDCLGEDPDNYVPFDIVAYCQGRFVYRFTRPEFKHIVKDRKNPWTKEDIPDSVLSTIFSRIKAAKDLDLPEPGTFKELIEALSTGHRASVSSDMPELVNADLSPAPAPRTGVLPDIAEWPQLEVDEEDEEDDDTGLPVPGTPFTFTSLTSLYPNLQHAFQQHQAEVESEDDSDSNDGWDNTFVQVLEPHQRAPTQFLDFNSLYPSVIYPVVAAEHLQAEAEEEEGEEEGEEEEEGDGSDNDSDDSEEEAAVSEPRALGSDYIWSLFPGFDGTSAYIGDSLYPSVQHYGDSDSVFVSLPAVPVATEPRTSRIPETNDIHDIDEEFSAEVERIAGFLAENHEAFNAEAERISARLAEDRTLSIDDVMPDLLALFFADRQQQEQQQEQQQPQQQQPQQQPQTPQIADRQVRARAHQQLAEYQQVDPRTLNSRMEEVD